MTTAATGATASDWTMDSRLPTMSAAEFGSCCKDLRAAMHDVPSSFFRVEGNGVLYLSVGYVSTPSGPGFFDQAVLFCPFCGATLQDRKDIASRS
jgi:hypothetical protein